MADIQFLIESANSSSRRVSNTLSYPHVLYSLHDVLWIHTKMRGKQVETTEYELNILQHQAYVAEAHNI